MNRTQDYVDFALRFCGLGYLLFWPLSTPQEGGAVFGASYVCGSVASAAAEVLCAPRPLFLPLPLHAAGTVAVLYALGACLFSRMRRRQRAARAEPLPIDIQTVAARLPALHLATDVPPGRPRAAPWSPPPRSRPQFGLRLPQTPLA